jgi:hypothetical protein
MKRGYRRRQQIKGIWYGDEGIENIHEKFLLHTSILLLLF